MNESELIKNFEDTVNNAAASIKEYHNDYIDFLQNKIENLEKELKELRQ